MGRAWGNASRAPRDLPSGASPAAPIAVAASEVSPAPSLLYREAAAYTDLTGDRLFTDLNLDGILASLSEGYEWADLPALFRQKPARRADAEFRLEILGDLRIPELREAFEGFSQSLRRARQHLASAEITAPKRVRQKWRLDACVTFCRAVETLLRAGVPDDQARRAADEEENGGPIHEAESPGAASFAEVSGSVPAKSPAPPCALPTPARAYGLRRFLEWLAEYAQSPGFREIRDASYACSRGFRAIRYQLAIDMPRNLVTLSADASEEDFCGDLAALFPQFDLPPAQHEIAAFSDIHVSALEERLLEILEAAHPEAFQALDGFCLAHERRIFPDPCLDSFQRELAFFLACLRHADGMTARGFAMCVPSLTRNREIRIEGGYDVSLALKSLAEAGTLVVANDFRASASERCFVLTGPNQAGKTTFARALGQAVYFASMGLPVAARRADIGFYPGLFTHFAVEEDLQSDSGRLKEELTRLRPLLDKAQDAFVILNELFASTTTLDARQMAAHALRALWEKGCACLYVTHLYELTAEDIGGTAPVSLVAAAAGAEGDQPAFTIERRSALGQGLSSRLLIKHRLDGARIKERYHAAFPSSY